MAFITAKWKTAQLSLQHGEQSAFSFSRHSLNQRSVWWPTEQNELVTSGQATFNVACAVEIELKWCHYGLRSGNGALGPQH